jgi:hypothetical protein
MFFLFFIKFFVFIFFTLFFEILNLPKTFLQCLNQFMKKK